MSFKWEKCANFSGFGTSKRNSFFPVVVDNGFDPALFEIEKKQLLASLAADMDDSFILHIKNWINCFS